jgi:hypothetical protein
MVIAGFRISGAPFRCRAGAPSKDPELLAAFQSCRRRHLVLLSPVGEPAVRLPVCDYAVRQAGEVFGF